MIKSITFTCKLDGLGCNDEQQIQELMRKVSHAVKSVHEASYFFPQAQVEIEEDVQNTAFGRATMDLYREVKRAKTGAVEYYHDRDGKTRQISKAEYDLAHGRTH